MSIAEQLAPLVGRCLVALVFFAAAAGKAGNPQATAFLYAAAGVPLPLLVVMLTLVIEALGAIAIAIGFRTRVAAMVLFVETLALALLFDNYWAVADIAIRADMAEDFLLRLGLCGALLVLFGLGSGNLSLDQWTDRRR